MATYITAKQLADRLGFKPNYINRLKDKFFIEGKHYIRPFGGGIRYIWEEVEREINRQTRPGSMAIPMANGGVCYG